MSYLTPAGWQSRLQAALVDGICLGLVGGLLTGLFALLFAMYWDLQRSVPNYPPFLWTMGEIVINFGLVFYPAVIRGFIFYFLTESFGLLFPALTAICTCCNMMDLTTTCQRLCSNSILPVFISCMYHGLMESSRQHSTLGLRRLGLVTVDREQHGISFTTAVIRYLLKGFLIPNNICKVQAQADAPSRLQLGKNLKVTGEIKPASWQARFTASLLDAVCVTFLANTLTLPLVCTVLSGADLGGLAVLTLWLFYNTILCFLTEMFGFLVPFVATASWFFITLASNPTPFAEAEIANRIILHCIFIANGLPLCFALLYHGLMEASSLQATFGKWLLGLSIVDKQGQRLSFGRTAARYFSKGLSLILLELPQLTLVFAPGQTLYDKAAGCMVIQRKPKAGQVTAS